MTDARPPDLGQARMIVRLSQVPVQKRLQVANRMIRLEGLVGVPALDLLMAATEPRQDPALFVPTQTALRILGA